MSILFGNVISLYISTSPKRKLRNNIDVIDSNTLRAIIKYVSRPKCASISIWISISISPIFWVTNNRQRRYRPTSTVDIVVTFARPAERVEVFNIFALPNSSETCNARFVFNFLRKINRRGHVIVQVKWKAVWETGVFRPCNISLFFENGKDTAIVTMEDE